MGVQQMIMKRANPILYRSLSAAQRSIKLAAVQSP